METGFPSGFCACRTNCKATCGLCGTQPVASSASSVSAAVPSPSRTLQIPLAYASGTLIPSPCSFSCVDIAPPGSPAYSCAQQARSFFGSLLKKHLISSLTDLSLCMQKSFGKCNSTFITTPAPGLPLGYCQVGAVQVQLLFVRLQAINSIDVTTADNLWQVLWHTSL